MSLVDGLVNALGVVSGAFVFRSREAQLRRLAHTVTGLLGRNS